MTIEQQQQQQQQDSKVGQTHQKEDPSSDDIATTGETLPTPQEMDASSSSSDIDLTNNDSDDGDVEKGVPKDFGNLDSDTDDTVTLEDAATYPPWVPMWFLNYGWLGVLAFTIPILFIIVLSSVMGHVFSSSSSSNNNESMQDQVSNVFALVSTPVPTTTPTTSLSPTIAPTTSTPSEMPSASPSDFPTFAPTLEPVVSHDFMVRLYWDPKYYWQETYQETWWCMECAECKKFVLGDGWQGQCVSPGPTTASCQAGDQIWVRKCKDKKRLYTFEIIKNFGSGDQVRVHGTDLCFSIKNEIYLELRPCNARKPEQLFAPIQDTMKFELRPYHQRDLSDKEAYCLSQRHHPKDEELVGMFTCRTNINHETNYWTEYYRD